MNLNMRHYKPSMGLGTTVDGYTGAQCSFWDMFSWPACFANSNAVNNVVYNGATQVSSGIVATVPPPSIDPTTGLITAPSADSAINDMIASQASQTSQNINNFLGSANSNVGTSPTTTNNNWITFALIGIGVLFLLEKR